MKDSKFQKIYDQIIENTTTSANVGSTSNSINSSDTYAAGDSRIPITIKDKKKKPLIIKRPFTKEI